MDPPPSPRSAIPPPASTLPLPPELAAAAVAAGLDGRTWTSDDVRAFGEYLQLRQANAERLERNPASALPSTGYERASHPTLSPPAAQPPQLTYDHAALAQAAAASGMAYFPQPSAPAAPVASTSQLRPPYSHPKRPAPEPEEDGEERDGEGEIKVKHRRSRKGCYTCRSRKIKCDEQRPVCRRCQVAKRECSFPPSAEDYTEDGECLVLPNGQRRTSFTSDFPSFDPSRRKRPAWIRHTVDPPDFLVPFLPPSALTSLPGDFGPRFPAPTFLDVDGSHGPSLAPPLSLPPQNAGPSFAADVAAFNAELGRLLVSAASSSTSWNLGAPTSSSSTSLPPGSSNASAPSLPSSMPDPLDALYPPSPFAIPFETNFPTASKPADLSTLGPQDRGKQPRKLFPPPPGNAEEEDGERRVVAPRSSRPAMGFASTTGFLEEFFRPEGPERVLVPKGMKEVQSPLLSTPDYLYPFFPKAEDRMLVHHYLTQSVKFIVALNLEMDVNPWIRIHAPLAFGMSADGSVGGSANSVSVEALRTGLLSVSAVHLAYLRGKDNAARDLAASLRRTAVRYLQKAVKHGETDSDTFLAATLSLAMRDLLAGDSGWKGILELANSVIQRRGGPAKMLEAEGAVGRPRRKEVSVPRFLLEQLATRDVFGSLTTGEEPMMIKGWSPWFHQLGETGSCDWEWESVERMFGLSRGMIDLMARISSLVARKRKLRLPIFEERRQRMSSSPLSPFGASSSSSSTAPSEAYVFSASAAVAALPPVGSSSADGEDEEEDDDTGAEDGFEADDPIRESQRLALQDEARAILAELDVWSTSMTFVQLHPRVAVGNHAHRYAMVIHILRNIFDCPSTDPRITAAVASILEVCSEGSSTGMVVWLTWPVLIAGMHTRDQDQRAWVLALLQGFRTQACWDVESAERILKESWRRTDAGDAEVAWSDLMTEMGLDVLLV